MWGRLWRRVRFGRPIVVVSGLPRSGTSMMMQMLAAGGLPLMTDGVRAADASNPAGYFELEAAKDLDQPGPHAWLARSRGRGVKILSPLLRNLPDCHNYRVIFLERPLEEVIASQDVMLAQRGEAVDVVPRPAVLAEYEAHLGRVRALLARRACFDTLFVSYPEAVADPRGCSARVAAFVGGLDPARMAEVIDHRLHRQRPS